MNSKFQLLYPFVSSGAYQRSRLYKSTKGLTKDAKKQLTDYKIERRNIIKAFLYEEVYLKASDLCKDEDKLFATIENLRLVLVSNKEMIYPKDVNSFYGNAQKFINLTLKGMKMAGWITEEPLHFPVDRIIQQRMKMGGSIIKWTEMDKKDYLLVINEAKRLAEKEKLSLYNWEYNLYNKS